MRNIPFGKPLIDDAEKEIVRQILSQDKLVHGPKAVEFEEDFASFTGGGYTTSLSSCTAGLHLSYFHIGLRQGDEVIIPAQTHVATAHAVEFCGARPVFVDAELTTGNIDLDAIENNISPATKAISLVHFLGFPVDMERICAIARKHNVVVVEDCALAMGTYFKGKHAGLWGDFGCFSFYPVKHMTTLEGGMLLSSDEKRIETLKRQKAFGVDRTIAERKEPGIYDVTMLGYNYRMNEVQAAIGVEQLKKMPSFLEKRERNFHCLYEKLQNIEEIDLFRLANENEKNSYYCLSILLGEKIKERRIEIVNFLKQNGVGTSVYYPKPVPHMSYYMEKYGHSQSEFPHAARISYNSIALPVGPHLDEEDMDYIAVKVKEAIASLG